MDENNFLIISNEALQLLFENLDKQIGDQVDVEYSDGVLTIASDEEGEYVITRHAPTKQIWVSSPISGASYYRYADASGTWVSTHDDKPKFLELVLGELEQVTGEQIKL